MLSKFNTIGVMSLILVALLLLCCFAGSTAYADGGGGQWPDHPPAQPTGGGDGGGGDGSSIIATITERPHGACTERSRVLQSPVNVVSEGKSGGGKEHLAESSSAERMSGKREKILKTEDSMLSKFNRIGVISLILMTALLVFCIAGSAVYAGDGGGGGGDWPDEVPPVPGGGGDGGGGDGSSIIVTITTILGVIL